MPVSYTHLAAILSRERTAYLAELHSGDSRRAVRSRLNIAARWLGAADAFSCEWGRLRYVHVLGFMHALADKEGLAAASVNAYLSALKGVAETAWRLRQIDLTTYAEIKAVKQLRVHREPTGRALQADESQKLLAAVDEDSGPKAVRDRALIALLLGCGPVSYTHLFFKNPSSPVGVLPSASINAE